MSATVTYLFAGVVAVWLVGLAVQVVGAVRHAVRLRKFGALLRGGAMAIGLPAVGGIAVISAGLSLLPDPLALLLLALGVIPMAISVFGYRFLRRATLEWSTDIHRR